FVSRGKINPALRIELLQQPSQSARIRSFRNGASDRNSVRSRITFGTHTTTERWVFARIAWRACLCEYVFMRTTIDLPDPVFRRMKAEAALEGLTIKEYIQSALEI